MLTKILHTVRERGIGGFAHAVRHRLRPQRARCWNACAEHVSGRQGLEIGGPSGVFSSRGILPLYDLPGALDNGNFASHTTWEGAIREGQSYAVSPMRPTGRQYIAETTNLHQIGDGQYDFLLSSHVLEHSANALLALGEWIRVVRHDGVLVLLLPHKDGTFDHRRPVTPLQHFVDDAAAGMTEDDLTHLPEILELHDLHRDPGAGTREQFERRSRANAQNRCLHHHVFDTRSVAGLIDHVGLELLALEPVRPNHIVALARKPGAGQTVDNSALRDRLPAILRTSPFASDRAGTPAPAALRR